MPISPSLPATTAQDVWGSQLNTAINAIVSQVNAQEATASGLAATLAGKAANDLSNVNAATGRTALGLGGAAVLNVGTSSGTVAAGDDSRLSNARTPTAHAATHASGGSDALTLAQAQVTGLVTSLAGKSDVGHAHAAGDIVSGTLPVGRGGTGVTTLGALQAALGLGLGASMYRASTSSADSATGTRTMQSYDTTRKADTGYTVDQAAGTITVPVDGIYRITGHARLSVANVNSCALLLSDGTNELLRSDFATWPGGLQDIGISGDTDVVLAGTALRLQFFCNTSAALVGNAAGTYYMFRVVRAG